VQNITHQKRKTRKKSHEIERFVNFLKSKSLKAADLAASIEIPERTITKFIWNDTPLSGAILRKLNTIYGVSIDWLLSGMGGMYMENNTVYEHPSDYQVSVQGEHRLINRKSVIDNGNLSDVYGLFAAVIEQSLIDVGAEPDKDYSYLDLYRLAQAHVLEEAKKTPLSVWVQTQSDND